MPESIRPTFPGLDRLDAAWRDVSEPALAGVRMFQAGAQVAVLVSRGALWDVVVTCGPDRPDVGVLKADEIVDALNAAYLTARPVSE